MPEEPGGPPPGCWEADAAIPPAGTLVDVGMQELAATGLSGGMLVVVVMSTSESERVDAPPGLLGA